MRGNVHATKALPVSKIHRFVSHTNMESRRAVFHRGLHRSNFYYCRILLQFKAHLAAASSE